MEQAARRDETGKSRSASVLTSIAPVVWSSGSPEHLLAAAVYLLAARKTQASSTTSVGLVEIDRSPVSAMGAGAMADARHCRCTGKAV